MSEAKQIKAATGDPTTLSEVVELDAFQGTREQRLPILKTYKLYIDGQFPRTESGRYYLLKNSKDEGLANVCLGSRKDFRNSVVVARKAFDGWAGKAAHNRGQILYRIAEMLEGRREQFISELISMGSTRREAEVETDRSIDRLVYYAGWADKYQQLFSCVNPVSSSHFNFSLPEPVGVVSVAAPENSGLLGLVSMIAPIIVGGNTCVVLASHSKALCGVTLGEVINSSDVPAGVVNILTGLRGELIDHMSSHMDVNAVLYCENDTKEIATVQTNASLNIKRVVCLEPEACQAPQGENPYLILEFQEIKTTWHPIGV
jgi:acyl-CoA reductase-like NAD-dependent aldehyde dehydrogenase